MTTTTASSTSFDAFPNDPAKAIDTDGDGTDDKVDPDDDNDGLTDVEEVDLGHQSSLVADTDEGWRE